MEPTNGLRHFDSICINMDSGSTVYFGSLMMGLGTLSICFCGKLTTCFLGDPTIIWVGSTLPTLGSSNCTLGAWAAGHLVSSCLITCCTLGNWHLSCSSISCLYPGSSCCWICFMACIWCWSLGFFNPCNALVRSQYAFMMMSAGFTSGCVRYLCLKKRSMATQQSTEVEIMFFFIVLILCIIYYHNT